MIRTAMGIGAPPNPEAAARGQKTFVATCGFCHGTNATGGAQGPNLVRSTMVLHDQGTGKEIAPVIHNGRPDKGMPAFAISRKTRSTISRNSCWEERRPPPIAWSTPSRTS